MQEGMHSSNGLEEGRELKKKDFEGENQRRGDEFRHNKHDCLLN